MAGLDLGFSAGPVSAGISGLGQGSGYRRTNRRIRKDYQYAARYQPEVIAANIKGAVRGAHEAGLHPLFALGSGLGDSTPAFAGAEPDTGMSGHVSHKAIRPEEAAIISNQRAQSRYYDALAKQTDQETRLRGIKALQQKNAKQDKPYLEGKHKGAIVESGIMKFANTPDAQDWEDRYWEFGGAAGALMNIGADAVANIPPEAWDAYVNNS